MSKYDLPDVIYRGYIITADQFTDFMNQIPTYKEVMDYAGYGKHDHVFRYVAWKKAQLDKPLRIWAPRMKEYWAPGIPDSDPPSHIMLLSSYINAKCVEMIKDHSILLERDKDLKVDDFGYAYDVGPNPRLITT